MLNIIFLFAATLLLSHLFQRLTILSLLSIIVLFVLLACNSKLFLSFQLFVQLQFLKKLISFEQSTFLKGLQILDVSLMVNELVVWFKKKGKKLMIFKVDFEKVYKSISQDYNDQILNFMGFGCRWRSWISDIFSNGRSLILLNRSLVEKVQLHKRLDQVDPISPSYLLCLWKVVTWLKKMQSQLVFSRSYVGFRHTFYFSLVLCR